MSDTPSPDHDWLDRRGVFVLFLFGGMWLLAISAMFWHRPSHKLIPPQVVMLGAGIAVIAAGIAIEVRRRRRAAAAPPPSDEDRGAPS